MNTSPLTTEMVAIDSLFEDPRNPRTISTHDFESLQRSIDEFGFLQPVVVNKRNMTICGGHQRVEAARALGIEKVPVVWVDLDDERQVALNIGMNKIGGEFNNDLLAELLDGLDDDMVALTGFDEDWPDLLQPQAIEEPEEKPDTVKAARFTTDELRTLVKSLYPTAEETVLDFLRIVDERSDKH